MPVRKKNTTIAKKILGNNMGLYELTNRTSCEKEESPSKLLASRLSHRRKSGRGGEKKPQREEGLRWR